MLDVLLTTLIKRPYVFLFLVSFLIISSRAKGWPKTFFFLFWGYLIAWISEALSIRTGFPYGWYFYVYENMQGEWMNLGVPVWDSLSYTFLCFAGLCVAEKLNLKSRSSTWIFSALFVVILDIIVDPLAHMGERWFLGKIYYYPNPGLYFDVPLSNFIGWFFVALVINGGALAADRFLKPMKEKSSGINVLIGDWGGLGLYFGIFLFNWVITLWLKEWTLALIDLVWISIPLALLLRKNERRNF